MGNLLLKNSFRWVILILIQLFIFANMTYYQFSTPFIYVLFILWLPFSTPNLVLFVLSFGTGYFLDYFYDTPGVHAAACTVMAMVRIIFINLTMANKDEIDGPEPTTKYVNRYWFFIYSTVCILAHHFTLYFLEAFKLNELHYTFIKMAIGLAFTLFLVLLVNFLFFKKSTR